MQALKQLPREQIQLATKFGIAGSDGSGMTVRGTPDYVRSCCEASLMRLGVDYIDLYYQHRVDKSVPIEDTVRILIYGSFVPIIMYLLGCRLGVCAVACV